MIAKGRPYVLTLTVLGLMALTQGLLAWESGNRQIFLCVAALAVVSASLRENILLPRQTVSLNLMFILLGFCWLTYSETLLVGCLSTLFEAVRLPRQRASWSGILFDTAVTALGIRASFDAYRSFSPQGSPFGQAAALAGAAVVLALILSFPSAAAATLLSGRRLSKAWRRQLIFSSPYVLGGWAAVTLVTAMNNSALWLSGSLILLFVGVTYIIKSHLEGKRRRALDGASGGHLATPALDALAAAMAAHNEADWRQYYRTRFYCDKLAELANLPEGSCVALRTASALCEWGKLALPDHILRKTGKLGKAELERLRIHPVVAAEIGRNAGFDAAATFFVRHHCEHWDGTGWPSGLCGNDIPLGARVLGLAEAMGALCAGRPPHPGLSIAEAVAVVDAQKGKTFDPALVEMLHENYREWEQELAARWPRGNHLTHEDSGPPATGDAELIRRNPSALLNGDIANLIGATRREDQTLANLVELMGGTLSVGELFKSFATGIVDVVPHDAAALFLLKDDALSTVEVAGELGAALRSMQVPSGSGLLGRVVADRNPAMNQHPGPDSRCSVNPVLFEKLGACLAVPLDGTLSVLGVVALYRHQENSFRPDDLRILLSLSSRLGTALESAVEFDSARNSAATDSLTGLANSGAMHLRLQSEFARSARSDTPMALLVCDLDNFKQFNDRYGHLEGNNLLRAVARRFREHCRGYDFVARMGGDEFVMLFTGISVSAVKARMDRLSEVVLEASREICGQEAVSLSVGDAYFPADGNTPQALLEVADQRMYQAKRLFKVVSQGKANPTAHDWLREKIFQ